MPGPPFGGGPECETKLSMSFGVSIYSRDDYDNGNTFNALAWASWDTLDEQIMPLPHTLNLVQTDCNNCGDLDITASFTGEPCNPLP